MYGFLAKIFDLQHVHIEHSGLTEEEGRRRTDIEVGGKRKSAEKNEGKGGNGVVYPW